MEIKINLQFPSSLHTGERLCWRRPQRAGGPEGGGRGRPPRGRAASGGSWRPHPTCPPWPRGAACPPRAPGSMPAAHGTPASGPPLATLGAPAKPRQEPTLGPWRETLGPHSLQLCTLHWGPGAESDCPAQTPRGTHTQVPGPGIPGCLQQAGHRGHVTPSALSKPAPCPHTL